MSNELKPCPICGGSSGLHRNSPPSKPDSIKYWIACENHRCRISGPYRSTFSAAIAAWNTRAPQPAPIPEDLLGQLERIEDCIAAGVALSIDPSVNKHLIERIARAEDALVTLAQQHAQSGVDLARLEAENAALKAQLAEARKAAEWTRIDAEHLPKVGDMVWHPSSGHALDVEEYELWDSITWNSSGYTHYRPIGAPNATK